MVNKKKSLVNRELSRVVVSFLLFLLVTAEAICGLWVNSLYKDVCLFGDDTWVARYELYGDDNITYAELKELIPDVDCSKLDTVYELNFQSGDVVYPGSVDDTKKQSFKDSDKFIRESVYEYYVENILLKKYKDHMATLWCGSYWPKNSRENVQVCFVSGPDSIVKSGKKSIGPDECVSIKKNSVGDDVYIAGEQAKVTGTIRNIQGCLGGTPSALLAYMEVQRIGGFDELYRFYDQIDDEHMLNGNEYDLSSCTVVFDRSKFSSEDIEILSKFAELRSVKSGYGRYATAYIYLFWVFVVAVFYLFVRRVKEYIKVLR